MLLLLPCGLHWAASFGGAAIHGAGFGGRACELLRAVRWLSLRPRSARGDGDAATCAPHAPEVVAMTAFCVIGAVAPLLAAFLTESGHRAAFAAAYSPRAPLSGPPAVVRWSATRRARAAAAALLVGSIASLSAIDLAADSL
jgi:hypothetical protein